jgi:hypothetical protein
MSKETRYQKLIARNTIHGCSVRGHVEKLYKTWLGMMGRCYYSKADNYKYYGGRGILVCEEWKKYAAFRAWAVQNEYSEELELDRVDNEKNYTPDNCRFASHSENMRHTRRTVNLTINGETACMSEWARRINVGCTTIHMWIRRRGLEYAEKRVQERMGA